MQFQTPKRTHPQIKKNKLTNKYSKDLEINKQSTNIDIKSCISLVHLQFLVFYYPKSLLVNFPLLITILSKYHILIVNMCVCVCVVTYTCIARSTFWISTSSFSRMSSCTANARVASEFFWARAAVFKI